ncbi:MAG: PKD domain-containing protein [Thiohalomonadales bacterium]
MSHGMINVIFIRIIKFTFISNLFFVTSLHAAIFTVNSEIDGNDSNAGDGICETVNGNGICSLRAALEETNALNGLDKIKLPSGHYTISTSMSAGSPSFLITDDLDLIGLKESTTIIDANVIARVFNIHSSTLTKVINVSISGVTVQNGRAKTRSQAGITSSFGGGIFVGESTKITLSNVVINQNLADRRGSGIYVGNNVISITMDNCVVENNGPIKSNNKNNIGAGIYIEEGNLKLSNSTIRNNIGHQGAGLYIAGDTTTILNSTVSNNVTKKTSQNSSNNNGGGIALTGQLTTLNIVNSTISDNQSDENGGGISMGSNTILSLYSSTISNNQVDVDKDGVGTGGGIYGSGKLSINLQNTIIANNSGNNSGPDCSVNSVNITSGGYNLISDKAGCLFSVVKGDLIGSRANKINPKLASLTNNGGPTSTIALGTGSPAIDAGNPNGCMNQAKVLLKTDQRGVPGKLATSRAMNGGSGTPRCDIGAYEANVNKGVISVIANAGSDQVVPYNTLVTLNGSKSKAANGIELYNWNQIPNSTVSLSDTTISNPTFISPDVSQLLTFKVSIVDVNGISSTNNTKVNIIVNAPPVARAGPDQNVAQNSKVTLNAKQSSDSDGTIEQYSWRLLNSVPSGTSIKLIAKDTPTPNFIAPKTNVVLKLELTVTDDNGVSKSDIVKIKVSSLPVVIIQPVTRVNYGELVILDGSQSKISGATNLRYLWAQQVGTDVVLSDSTVAKPNFHAPAIAGELQFKLTVSDVSGNNSSDIVSVFINSPPVSNAGENVSANVNETVTLNGNKSFDNDGTISSYSWKQVHGENVALSNVDTSEVSFIVPKEPGLLTFSLTVTDNDNAKSSDHIEVKINDSNNPLSNTNTIGGGGGGCSVLNKSKFDPLFPLLILLASIQLCLRKYKLSKSK